MDSSPIAEAPATSAAAEASNWANLAMIVSQSSALCKEIPYQKFPFIKKKKKQNTNGMKELSFSLKTAALLSEHGGAGPWWVNARLMSYSG